MKNSLGFLFLLKILLSLLIFSCASPTLTFAQSQINETMSIFYSIDKEHSVHFVYTFELTTPEDFATAITQYSLSLPFSDFNLIAIKLGEEDLKHEISTEEDLTKITLDLNNRILNSKSPILITIEGKINTPLVSKIDDTKIAILPGNVSNVNVNKVEITYPKDFGEVWDSQNYWVVQHENENIRLKGFDCGKNITLAWGNKIAYDFNITKQLFNSTNEPKKVFEVNIPKSHGNQKVLFYNIDPMPTFAYQDAEGNLFFSYELDPGSEIEIKIFGQIIIDFLQEKDLPIKVFSKPILTETKGYWLLSNEYELNRLKIYLNKEGITEENIEGMDTEKREKFYEFAYQYVVERLEFANVRSTSMESNIRQGADHAVLHRTSAAPEDYVDLLISIYRHYGVPTRMIEGYITMQNQGFYHSWLEFWEDEKGWRALDPALADYSNNKFFETNFFNHVTILSRGYNYIRPRMIFFDKNDFQVNLSESILHENLSIENSITFSPLKKTTNQLMAMLEVKNTGNTIVKMPDLSNNEQLIVGNYNALQLIVPGQAITIPIMINLDSADDVKSLNLRYISLNNSETSNNLEIEPQEDIFWWWGLLIFLIKTFTVLTTTYIIYLISSKIFRWTKRYYQ